MKTRWHRLDEIQDQLDYQRNLGSDMYPSIEDVEWLIEDIRRLEHMIQVLNPHAIGSWATETSDPVGAQAKIKEYVDAYFDLLEREVVEA